MHSFFIISDNIIVASVAFLSTLFIIPIIIRIAKVNNYYDFVNTRKIHKGLIPRIGGVAIILGFLIAQWFAINEINLFKVHSGYFTLICLLILLFITGLIDDLLHVHTFIKFIVCLTIASILVFYTNIRFDSFYGLLGVYKISFWLGSIFSILYITLIINSINLIDGLDGLLAYFSCMVLIIFGGLFLVNQQYVDFSICTTSVACLAAFLIFNKYPARIFMGDGGSLTIGLVLAYLSIRLVTNSVNAKIEVNPVFILAILSYPITDTLRVFTLRILKGVSPFTPDKNHLHHNLYRIFKNQNKVTFVLIIFTILLTVVSFVLKTYPITSLFIITIVMAIFSQVPAIFLKRKKIIVN